MRFIMGYVPYSPFITTNIPNNTFRSRENERNHFRFADDETMNSLHMGRLAKLRWPGSTIFRLVVDEKWFHHLRNERAGFRHLGDEVT